MFIATINRIEDALDIVPPTPSDEPAQEEEVDRDCYGLRRLAGRISAIRRFDSGVDKSSTPMKLATTDSVLRYIDESGRQNSIAFDCSYEMEAPPSNWLEFPPWVAK